MGGDPGWQPGYGVLAMHHLETLRLRLSHELDRYAHAKTPDERRLRKVWIEQIEKEILAALTTNTAARVG